MKNIIPVANKLPSREKAQQAMYLLWPESIVITFPVLYEKKFD